MPDRTTGSRARDLRIGIDVGGTNTDAVVLGPDGAVLTCAKRPTSADVTSGLQAALAAVLSADQENTTRVGRVMLGTTHATNAILERRWLGKVAAIRLGAPATTSVPPMQSWPPDLSARISAGAAVLPGGNYIDGTPVSPMDTGRLRAFLGGLAGKVNAVALTAVFSPAYDEQELAAAEIVREELGEDVPISMSHEIGTLGLLARESATIFNASLYQVIGDVAGGLYETLAKFDMKVATYFAQNDGTLMALDYAARYPVLTIGSGPANSIRGAAYLSGLTDAVVVDVGGTSTDFGVLNSGFPRESSAGIEIGGVRTNFRMPDILSLALGGGTIVGWDGTIGSWSVGHRITELALSFGGETPTMTDAGVLAGRTKPHTGSIPPDRHEALTTAIRAADDMLDDAVDRMTLGKVDMPLVVVGGGGFLVPDELPGVAEVIRPPHGNVANAVGAAVALVSGTVETIIPDGGGRRDGIDAATELARRRAVQAGADPNGVEVVEVTEIPLSYLPEPVLRLRVKAAGPLGSL
jgi:N-methylhydantoinase A/oxoprolinase/acetone carboxylase beta subunit